MLDHFSNEVIRKPLNFTAKQLDNLGITADQVTLSGFFFGLLCFPALVYQEYKLALLFIIVNRIFDGIDGAIARRQGITDAGGFLDITLDFLFYSLVPFGFIVADPQSNSIAGAFLIFSFVGTGSSFLAFAIMAGKRNIAHLGNPAQRHKSLYYIGGLTEGTETILCFALLCLVPQYFSIIAYTFGFLCWLTTATRIWTGYQALKH
ncbi:CDP-alcohol phosphatidyltransferase family protein [Psychromonas sp.]|uniref:CDP-alcohol phosphatidyltransferase family protein n=1 Tax=Psychromonas sp. TaxID=1884585 RepID=UPI003563E535